MDLTSEQWRVLKPLIGELPRRDGRYEFRRLVVRYERHALNYLGFVHLACILILLRQGL